MVPSSQAAHHRLGSRNQPEQTRQAILAAALQEFADEGLEGARTDAIASAAGVNKALLYYYFGDKERLYGAVLDHVFSGLALKLKAAMDRPGTPRDRILNYAAAHFDYIAGSPLYPRLVHREFMRSGRRPSPHLQRIVDDYFRPIYGRLEEIVGEGMRAGEFRNVDARQFVLSMIAVIVFYFNSLPVIQAMCGWDPMEPLRVAERRRWVVDFISAALFQERRSNGPGRKTGKKR